MSSDAVKPDVQVARPTQFSQAVVASLGFVGWLVGLITEGWLIGLENSWLLLLAVAVAGANLLRRLKFNDASIEVSVGPFRQRADLTKLRSISYKTSPGGRAGGILYVSDETGAKVSVYVHYFTRSSEWAAVLLQAAAATGARVQPVARHILQSEAENQSGR